MAQLGLVPTQIVGGPDAALAILGTIATSMVTLAALVLTITMVVVQLAMGAVLAPHRPDDPAGHHRASSRSGCSSATFAHAMLTMRESTSPRGRRPGIAILTAFVLVIASIILLVLYVHHLGQSLRVASLIELVGDRMRELVEPELRARVARRG